MPVLFKHFIENRIYTPTPIERKQIDEIYKTYLTLFNPDKLKEKSPLVVYKKRLQSDNTLQLGTIKYTDHVDGKTKALTVNVGFDSKASAAAGYSKDTNSIILFYNTFKQLSQADQQNTILHEVLHAKQHYKKLRPQDILATQRRVLPSGEVSIRSKQVYYTSPNEFPIQLASIIDELQRQYDLISANINKESGRKFWQKQRTNFLELLMTFIRSSTMPKSLPSYLKSKEDFVRTLFRIKDKPDYKDQYKKFKLTLLHYYQRLSARSGSW